MIMAMSYDNDTNVGFRAWLWIWALTLTGVFCFFGGFFCLFVFNLGKLLFL